MRLFFTFLCLSLTLACCSPSSEGPSTGGQVESGQGQAEFEVELPPSLSPEALFELVGDSSIEDMFARTAGIRVRPMMLTYQGGLFFLVLDFASQDFFPIQGGDELRMAVSTDGQDWAVSDQMIFSYTDGQPYSFRPFSMLRLADGSYALYGSAAARTIETIQSWAAQTAIIQATASNPMDSWAFHSEPLLLPGSATSWDRVLVWSPYVFADSDGFRMYYWGQPSNDFNADNGIGIAVSEDGIVWQKTLPGSNDQVEGESNRLIARSQAAWEEITLLHVWQTLDGWQLMYYLRDRRDSGMPHLAFSRDGIEWTPLEGDIQLPESTTPDDLIYASLTYAQERYWIMYCVGIDSTFCYLARTAN